MLLPNVEMVYAAFQKEDIKEFTKASDDKTLTFFYIEKEMAYCPKCKDITTGQVLCYRVGENEQRHYSACTNCKNKLEYLKTEQNCMCPLCGAAVNPRQEGLWD